MAVRRRFERASELEPSYLVSPRADAATGRPVELANEQLVREVVAELRPEAVVHLGGIMGAACEADPVLTHEVNVRATRVLADAAAEAGAHRFVLASSSAVYGDQARHPITENAPVVTPSLYARSKAAAETQLAEASDSYPEFTAVALRIFNIYGPGFHNSLVSRLENSTQDAPVLLNGLDNFVRDYVHVDDVVTAIVASLGTRLETPMHAINIASGEPVSNRLLVRRLGALGDIHYTVGAGEYSYSCADVARARAELGSAPRLVGLGSAS